MVKLPKNCVFVDSNVFIALANKDDYLHQKAKILKEKLRKEKARLVISNLVLAEILTVLSIRVSKKKAVEFGELVFKKSKQLIIIRATSSLEELAFSYFKKIKSKNVSFVDCLTLAIVEVFGIKRVFSFDKDLLQPKTKFELIS